MQLTLQPCIALPEDPDILLVPSKAEIDLPASMNWFTTRHAACGSPEA